MLVHLDTDIGGDTDDACALAMLLRWPGVELTGITTCTELQGQRAGMARYILRLAGREEVPVAAGAQGKLGPAPWPMTPGLPPEQEFWPEAVEPVHNAPGAAMDLLEASIAKGAAVIGIGPFTNLAAFEALRPGQLAQVPVFLMGRYLQPPRAGYPQWTREMDYNIQQDPEASLLVIERCAPVLVPISVTAEVFLREADLPRLEAEGPLGKLLAHQGAAHAAHYQMKKVGSLCPGLPEDLLNFHYDPLTCAAAVGWDGVTFEQLPIKTELRDGTIAMRIDPAGTRRKVVTATDGERFNRHWLDVVTRSL